MKEIKIYNKQNLQIFGATLQENEIDSWLEVIGKAKGLPERWILADSESYEESDVLESEERVFSYTDYEVNELGHTVEVQKDKVETWVKLKADYTIEIIDLDTNYNWLLSECHRKRQAEYPPISELGDALYWKENGNESKYIEYIGKCDAVKKKYPLPIKGGN